MEIVMYASVLHRQHVKDTKIMADNHRRLTQRSVLADVLPLNTPFVVHIDVASACNFRCKFCFHSLKRKTLDALGFSPGFMNMDLFKAAVDQIRGFPSKLKRLCLIRHGEALMNKHLPEMIRYAKASDIADQINISTNGSLLTPDITDQLLCAGLDEMLVSVEGLSGPKYKAICGAKVDFDQLVENIKYFNNSKKDTSLYVKIIDYALDDDGDEELFHKIFNPICDKASVEYMVPCFRGVDYATLKSDYQLNIIGDRFVEVEVCPQPFFQMHIFPNGNVSVCNADYNEKLVMGNVTCDSLVDIWEGKALNQFRTMHLKGLRKNHDYCSFCAGNVCYTSKSDILDQAAAKLLEHYKG